jgi:hypothetical protein
MTEEQSRNLKSAQNLAATRIGWEGSTKDIPYELSESYVTALARIILTNPERFDALTVKNASDELADADNPRLEKQTLGESVKIFGGEFANQAERINPLSQRNWGGTRLVIIGAILLAAVVYFGGLASRSRAVLTADK